MENQDFLEKLSRTRYRGGPEIRPVAGAGATPQLHYEGLKRTETGKQNEANMESVNWIKRDLPVIH